MRVPFLKTMTIIFACLSVFAYQQLAHSQTAIEGFHLPPTFSPPLHSRQFESVDDAKEVLRRIVISVGVISPNFTVVASDQLSNAAAWISGNRRFIGYRPAFMSEILAKAGSNYFSLIGIVAHEVGHHFLGHTMNDLSPSINSPPPPFDRGAVGLPSTNAETDQFAHRRIDELEADYFSGFVLARLGASKQDATAWLSGVSDPGEGASHPRNAERRRRIHEGWDAAAGSVNAFRKAPGVDLWDHNGSSMRLVRIGRRALFFYEAPRQAIADRGVDPGTLLFDGYIDGDYIEGLIYAFSFNCGKFAYQASGRIMQDGTIIDMTGLHPIINRNCEVVRRHNERLLFAAN